MRKILSWWLGLSTKIQVTKITIEHFPFLHRARRGWRPKWTTPPSRRFAAERLLVPSRSIFGVPTSRCYLHHIFKLEAFRGLQLGTESQIGIVIRCPPWTSVVWGRARSKFWNGRPRRWDIIRRSSPPTKPARLLRARVLCLPPGSPILCGGERRWRWFAPAGRRNIPLRSPLSAVLILVALLPARPTTTRLSCTYLPRVFQASPLLLGPRSLLLSRDLPVHNPRLHQHSPLPRDHIVPALHLVGGIFQHLHLAQEHLLSPSKLVDSSLHLDHGVHVDPCEVWRRLCWL